MNSKCPLTKVVERRISRPARASRLVSLIARATRLVRSPRAPVWRPTSVRIVARTVHCTPDNNGVVHSSGDATLTAANGDKLQFQTDEEGNVCLM